MVQLFRKNEDAAKADIIKEMVSEANSSGTKTAAPAASEPLNVPETATEKEHDIEMMEELYDESKGKTAPAPAPDKPTQTPAPSAPSLPAASPAAELSSTVPSGPGWAGSAEAKLRDAQTAYETEKLRQDTLDQITLLGPEQVATLKSRIDSI